MLEGVGNLGISHSTLLAGVVLVSPELLWQTKSLQQAAERKGSACTGDFSAGMGFTLLS